MENNYMDVNGDLTHAVWKKRAERGDIVLERGSKRVLVSDYSIGTWQISRETLRAAHQLYLKDKRNYGELPPRLLELAGELGLQVPKVSVRNQRWRWGSCSPKGHICLNWRLVTMPGWVRDYVLVHELMHLRRLDHSRKFWKLVAQACPAYQDARRWLREHGRSM